MTFGGYVWLSGLSSAERANADKIRQYNYRNLLNHSKNHKNGLFQKSLRYYFLSDLLN